MGAHTLPEDMVRANARFGSVDDSKAVTFAGAHTFSGIVTFSGANVVTGVQTFSGANTHSGNETHTGMITSTITMGTSTSTRAFTGTTTSSSVSASTSIRPIYNSHTATGAGSVGHRAEFAMTTNVALGGWSNALKSNVVYGASGSTAGLGSSFCAELTLSAGTSSGTYAALESEMVLGTGASCGTKSSFLYCNATGAGVAAFDTAGVFLHVGAGLTQASGKILDSTINSAAAQIDHTLKCYIEGIGTVYLGFMDNADGS